MMRAWALLLLTVAVRGQVSFDDSDGDKDDVSVRLGLIAGNLGLDPLGSTGGNNVNSPLVEAPAGRVPPQGGSGQQQCCCIPIGAQCSSGGGFGGTDDLVSGGFIDVRGKATNNDDSGISTRIVNRPGSGSSSAQINACPVGQQTCCFDGNIDLSLFGQSCINPQEANGKWLQGCSEQVVQGGKECGRRQFSPASGRGHGQSSPGEFPWTCLLLSESNSFIGTCAIIPEDFSNNNNRGTRKVITAAHKLSNVGQRDLLKVRVGEYDASGFNLPETVRHEEYTVVRILKHPQYNPARLDNDLAILTLERNIDLSKPTVNTACLPSCTDQFDFRFTNGTGTRCWVAGWGKNEADGSFQVIQRKVDIPLVDSSRCNSDLKRAISAKSSSAAARFQLHSSELCAGGEVGKDACTGDGGSPLVCESLSGRWTVVGLVTWGVGCASEVPGVYARLSYFRDWINAN